MEQQVRVSGKWYALMEIRKREVVLLMGSKKVMSVVVPKRDVEAYRTV